MQMRTSLSPTGPEVSRLVAGTMTMDDPSVAPAERLRFVHELVELGVTSFDHADIYGGYAVEALFGEALALDPGLRDQVELVTKCGIGLVAPARPGHRVKHYDSSGAHVRASVERSLRDLGTDRIDLLLLHRPDALMDPDDTGEALDALVAAGDVQHVGVSNFTPQQVDLLASRMQTPLVTNQVEVSVAVPELLLDGTVDHALHHRMAPMVWSPLGGGGIFGASDPQSTRLRDALTRVGDELGGASVGQAALAWLLTHPAGLVPVLGSGKVHRWQEYVEALDLRLDRQQWYDVLEASRGHEVA